MELDEATFFFRDAELREELGEVEEKGEVTLDDKEEVFEDCGATYQGEWTKDGKSRQGRGVLSKRTDGTSYEGYFLANKFHRQGKLTYPDNDHDGRTCYLGLFKAGRFHGHGTIFLRDGAKYQATWSEHAPIG